MLIADSGGNIVWANAAAARILGRESPAELFGNTVMAVLFSPGISNWDELSSRIQKTGTFTGSVISRERMDAGATLDIRVSHAAEVEKEWYYLYPVPGTVATAAPAQHDEDRLSLALQCAGLGVWDVDLNSGDIRVDERCAEMIGYRREELASLTRDEFLEYLHPDDRDAWFHFASGWSEGKNLTGTYEMRMRHKDTTWVWIRSRWQVFQSPETAPVLRVTGVHQDITNTVRKDDAIHEAQKKIAMLSSVTRHDILNQVTVIRMLFDIMEMTGEVPVDSDTWMQLSKINDSAITIERQIGFTRDYEDLGSQPPAWQHIGDLVDRVTVTSDVSHLTVICSCRNLVVYADPMLERVMHEIFMNTTLHGGDVTTITVSCLTKSDGTAVVDISDDGVGIADNRKERIFSRGIGIKTRYGLYLSREILSVTGITIQETGTEGTGAVFSLSVPQDNWKIPRDDPVSS
jgi:PAS domain S-box-containing protein